MAKIDEILAILDKADEKTIKELKQISGEIFILKSQLRDLKTKFQNEISELEKKINNLVSQRDKLINTKFEK